MLDYTYIMNDQFHIKLDHKSFSLHGRISFEEDDAIFFIPFLVSYHNGAFTDFSDKKNYISFDSHDDGVLYEST